MGIACMEYLGKKHRQENEPVKEENSDSKDVEEKVNNEV